MDLKVYIPIRALDEISVGTCYYDTQKMEKHVFKPVYEQQNPILDGVGGTVGRTVCGTVGETVSETVGGTGVL